MKTKEEKRAADAKRYQENKEKIKARTAKYYKENKEKIKVRTAKYCKEHREEIKVTRKKYLDAHKEETKVWQDKYNDEHKEERKPYYKKYWQEHKEEKRTYDKIYYKTENGKILSRFRTAKRRAMKLNQTPPWADLEKIKEIYRNCPEGYEVDHIHPLSKGGLHVDYNLQYLTEKENRIKSNKILY